MNNVHILIPRRKRSNPGWLVRLARWIGECRTIIADYQHFRAQGDTREAARFKAITLPALPAIGTPMPGGFFLGAFMLNGQRRACIVAAKKFEIKGAWHKDEIDVPGASSYNDGMANTKAMAEAGSEIAQKALSLEIDGLSDFYIMSQDEAELAYRNAKPTTDKNWCYARSGINVSAIPPTYPYTPDLPAQTSLEAFKAGGEQAFKADAYWTSTQHAGYSRSAWCQDFVNGNQGLHHKSAVLAVRCVRSQPI